MKVKIKKFVPAFLLTLYTTFTITCGGLGWSFRKWRIELFQVWYQVTALIWFILAITVIVLLVKLCKLNKLKNEMNHWKE